MLRSIEPSQFRSRAFVETLKHNGLTGSMGRVGAAGDNASMESFFSLLQLTSTGTDHTQKPSNLTPSIFGLAINGCYSNGAGIESHRRVNEAEGHGVQIA